MTALALAAALLLQADPAAAKPAAEPATNAYQAREPAPGHAKTAGSTTAAPAPARTAGSTTGSAYGAREPGAHTAPATGTAPGPSEQK
jgi:hypothetical protein